MENSTEVRKEVPIWRKYAISIDEAAAYFHIGRNKLREIVQGNPEAPYVLINGPRYLIKREMFEKYLDKQQQI